MDPNSLMWLITQIQFHRMKVRGNPIFSLNEAINPTKNKSKLRSKYNCSNDPLEDSHPKKNTEQASKHPCCAYFETNKKEQNKRIHNSQFNFKPHQHH